MSKFFHGTATKILALQIVLLPIAVMADWGTNGRGFWGNVVAVDVLVMVVILALLLTNGAEVKR